MGHPISPFIGQGEVIGYMRKRENEEEKGF
jgi:hypothetical protein